MAAYEAVGIEVEEPFIPEDTFGLRLIALRNHLQLTKPRSLPAAVSTTGPGLTGSAEPSPEAWIAPSARSATPWESTGIG